MDLYRLSQAQQDRFDALFSSALYYFAFVQEHRKRACVDVGQPKDSMKVVLESMEVDPHFDRVAKPP